MFVENNNESNNIELENIIDNKELDEIEVYDLDNNTVETYDNFLKRIKKNKIIFFVFVIIFILLLLFLFYKFFIYKKPIKIINDNINDNTSITIGTFTLDTDGVFNELHYKYDLVFEVVGLDNALELLYGSSDIPTISMKFDYIPGKELDQVYEQYFNYAEDKKEININNIKWIYIDGTEKIYLTNFNNNTYIVRFTSQVDITELINTFMDNIRFSI